MKRKGIVKWLTAFAVLALVLCLLPARAEAGSVSTGSGFHVNIVAFNPDDCSDDLTDTCKNKDGLGRHGVSGDNLVVNCSVKDGKLSVSGSFQYTCREAAKMVSYSCDLGQFSCEEAFYTEQRFAQGGGTYTIRVERTAGHHVTNWSSVGDGTHKGTCNLCGVAVTGNCAGDSAANCTTAGTCSTCGGSYMLPDAHDYSWKNDGANHWQECANNSAHKLSEGACAVGTNGSAATCEAAAVCGTCGKTFGVKDETAHAWGGWTHGAVDTNHSRTCTRNSAHTETLPHVFDYAIGTEDTGILYGTCATCGYKMEARLVPDTGKSTVYNGSAITPLKITYSDNWVGEKIADTAIAYSGNVNAGEASGTVTIAGKQLTCKFTIGRAPLTITDVTAGSRVYDGTKNVAITALTFTGTINGDDVDIKLPAATIAGADADTYNAVTLPANSQLELTGADKGNYVVTSGSVFAETVTISPKEITAAIKAKDSVYGKVTAPVITFNGLLEADKACTAVTYEGTTEKVVDGVKVTYQGTEVPTEAGTYTVKIAVNSGNYKLTGTTTAGFKIAKAPADYDAPKAIKLTYNGEEQALVTAGVIRGNKNSFQYRKESDKTWGAAIPTAKNVGTVEVSWRFEEDENHLGASGKVEAAIEPAVLTVTPDADQKVTYGKDIPTLTYKVKGAVASEEPAFTGELAVYDKNAGTYEIKQGTLKLKDKGTFKASNYEIKLEKVKFTINVAYLTLKAEDQNITCGASLDSRKYTLSDLAYEDEATVTLTPSTTNITYDGSITPSAVIENEEGEDVSENYYIAVITGKLVIEPDFASIEGMTAENVNHTHMETIRKLQESLKNADTTEATAAQKNQIEEAGETCAALLERIEKSVQAMETDAIKNTAEITEADVKLSDETAIRQALAEIETARTDFAGNYTAEDLEKLDGQTAQLKAALEVIERAGAVIDMVAELPTTVKAEDADAARVRAAFNGLAEYEKGLVKTSSIGKLVDAVFYKIISGNGSTWERGKSLSFTIDGDHTRFTGIEVDGKPVNEKFYEAEAGSTVVTLKKAYQKKLSGKTEHTVTFRFDDGAVDGVFYVSGRTGGFSFIGLLIWLTVLATAAGAAYLYIRKKKNG